MSGITLKLNAEKFSKDLTLLQCCKDNSALLFELFKLPYELSCLPKEYPIWVNSLIQSGSIGTGYESPAIKFCRELDDLTLLFVTCIDTIPSHMYIAERVMQISYALAVNNYALFIKKGSQLPYLKTAMLQYACTPTRLSAYALTEVVHDTFGIERIDHSDISSKFVIPAHYTSIQAEELYPITQKQYCMESDNTIVIFKNNCVQLLKAYGIELKYNKIPKPEIFVNAFDIVRAWYRSNFSYYKGMSCAGYFTSYIFVNGHIDLQRMSNVVYFLSCNGYRITALKELKGDIRPAARGLSVVEAELYPPKPYDLISSQDVWNKYIGFQRTSQPSMQNQRLPLRYFNPEMWDDIKDILTPDVTNEKYRIYDNDWGFTFIYSDKLRRMDLLPISDDHMKFMDSHAQLLAHANYQIMVRQLHGDCHRYPAMPSELNIEGKDLVDFIKLEIPEAYADLLEVFQGEDYLWYLLFIWIFQYDSDIYSGDVPRRAAVVSYYLAYSAIYLCEDNPNYIDMETFDDYIDRIPNAGNGPWYSAGKTAYEYFIALRSEKNKEERLSILKKLPEFSTGFFKEYFTM